MQGLMNMAISSTSNEKELKQEGVSLDFVAHSYFTGLNVEVSGPVGPICSTEVLLHVGEAYLDLSPSPYIATHKC